MPLPSWKHAYPPPPPRPPLERRPPWCRIPPLDLKRALDRARLPLRSIRTIVELGSGACHRILAMLAATPALNRPDVTVTCVDLSPNAIYWAMDEWNRMCLGLVRGKHRPRWSMRFIASDALALTPDRLGPTNLLVDWMMLHGLDDHQVARYQRLLEAAAPDHFLLKCFDARAGGEPIPRPAVHGITKRRWTQEQVVGLVSPNLRLVGSPHLCRARPDLDDGDGPREAKREYYFQRASDSRD